MLNDDFATRIENRLREMLHQQLRGLKRKVEKEFSQESFIRELTALHEDPVYRRWFLDSEQYVIIRFIGRVSISIGRRLGEIYEKFQDMLLQHALNYLKIRLLLNLII